MLQYSVIFVLTSQLLFHGFVFLPPGQPDMAPIGKCVLGQGLRGSGETGEIGIASHLPSTSTVFRGPPWELATIDKTCLTPPLLY